jgi:N-sulfoglucosamine sulfohydrolase
MMRLYLFALLLSASPALAGPKNVLLVIADDLGMQVGCYGDKTARTPNIDALAATGTRFTHAFASVASCSPSRATILTGMPTHQCGQYGLAHAEHNASSFARVKGLPALLAPAGYKSGSVAKLHVQPKSVYPFDEELPGGGGRNPVAVTEAARKFIAGCGDKPFFLLVGFTDPHRVQKGFANENKYPPSVPAAKFDPATVPVPYHLPDQPEVRQEMAEYYQSVARLDHGVGLLMNLLKEMKKDDDTLVIFLSDNGIPFPGAKTTLYDAGVHLPLIVRKPGQTAMVSSAMASWTDIAPTILDWAGVKQPEAVKGRSLLPVLNQEQPAGWDVVFGSHQYHEATMYYPMRMVRTRTHKLLLNYAHRLEYPHASDLWNSPSWQGVLARKDSQMGQRTVEQYLNRPKYELYDVTADPHELKNVAADPKQAETLVVLKKQLGDWQKATGDLWLVKDKHE